VESVWCVFVLDPMLRSYGDNALQGVECVEKLGT